MTRVNINSEMTDISSCGGLIFHFPVVSKSRDDHELHPRSVFVSVASHARKQILLCDGQSLK